MARIRSIKPDFFRSPTIARLSLRARLTFAGIWCYVDDDGRGYDEPRLIKAEVWPLDDDVSHGDVAVDIAEIEAAGLIERWVDGRPLLRVRSFEEHQRISHPKKSTLPASPEESSPKGHESTRTPQAPEMLRSRPADHRSPPENGSQEVEEEREVEEEKEKEGEARPATLDAGGKPPNGGPACGQPSPAAQALAVTAAALVTQRAEEIPVIVADLVAKHGHDPATQAINDLHGRAFTWPSELRRAAEQQLARRRSPPGSGPQRSPPDWADDPPVDPDVVRTALAAARTPRPRKATR